MTRQSRARWLAFATALLVVLLAALFTWLRNLTPAPDAATAATDPTANATAAAGPVAFARAGCTACHSAEGQGNRASPLDGIGSRLDRDTLRASAFGQSDRLPPAAAAVKRARAGDADADVVLDYLQRLR